MPSNRNKKMVPKPFVTGPAVAGSTGKQVTKTTINEIARLAGVSKKTVSRVINRSPLVRENTRLKVETLMRDVAYVPNPMARALAFQRSFLIGMVYDNPNTEYIVNMQNGALDSLRDTGYELVVHPCDSKNADYIEGVRRFILQHKLYGVLLVPRVSEDQELVDMLIENDCRYARIAAISLDEDSKMITTNDRKGAIEVAKYLESLGHKHIAMITGPQRYLSTRERGGGFLETLANRGLKVPTEFILEGGYTFESGVACAERLLTLNPRPTAIFALNDEMAAGVYKAAHKIGLSVPEDVSVVGFDDSPIASRLWPSLSTVRLPIRDMGLYAAAMLLADVSKPAPAPMITPHLLIRESCQPPK
jgi:LacI family transcriptional regulator